MEKITIKELEVGMRIRIHDNSKSDVWIVLDIGHPFVLLENTRTHFAQLYHYHEFYVENGN